jgi:hypothetical protein
MFWRRRSLIFSDEDVAAFVEALRTKYPRIRFVMQEYWRVQDRGTTALPTVLAIPYRETLTSPGNFKETLRRAWLEAEGWQARWSAPNRRGYRFIENEPRLSFTWMAPCMRWGSWFDEKGRSKLDLGEITAQYVEGDKEHIGFINSVWRIIAGLSTNKTPWCYHELATGRILGPFVASEIWIGHEALKWVRQDARHCFFHRHRPCDSLGDVQASG